MKTKTYARLISAMMCLIMLISVMPAAFAAPQTTLSSVTVNFPAFPVAGRALGNSYSLPSGVHYVIDDNVDRITWYELAPDADNFVKVAAGSKAKYDYIYKAEIRLIRENSDYIWADSVKVNVGGAAADKVAGTPTAKVEKSSFLTVSVLFPANTVYGANLWPELYVDREDPIWPVAGEHPWASGMFKNDNPPHSALAKEFNIKAEWYNKSANYLTASPLKETDVFEAGKEYHLRLIIKTGNAAIFEDTEYMVVSLNGTPLDLTVVDDTKVYAEYDFTVASAITSADIESIASVEAGAAPQKSGFTTSTNGLSVAFDRWVDATGSVPIDFTGDKFVAGKKYELWLTLTAESGRTLNLTKESIAVNAGTLKSYSYNNSTGEGTVVIGFSTDAKDLNTAAAYVAMPVAGELPSYNASVPANAGYDVWKTANGNMRDGVKWFDCEEEKELVPGVDTFVEGREYRAIIALVPDGEHRWAGPFTVTINGTVGAPELSGNVLYVKAIFKAAAKTDPKPDPFDCHGVIENCPSLKMFADAPAYGNWAHGAIDWAMTNGVTNGIDDSHFGPAVTCNRGQIVTFLWRASGSPEPKSAKNPFTDVKSSAFYYKAVMWAVENGITNGMTDTTFGPSAKCTRAQVVTFLMRTFVK